ncbi:unnamed protein product, partial [Mesorhabditis spiculigera]
MKRIVEGECGRSNDLVGLANQFGTTNQRVQSNIPQASSSLLPSSSQGELFANEFLQQKAQRTAAPRSFNTGAFLHQRPNSAKTAAMAQQWGSEFASAQQQSLGNQWANQYQAAMPSRTMEAAWSQAVVPANLQQGSSHDSGMWSAEFLDQVDTSLGKTRTDIYTDAWADAEVEKQSRAAEMDQAWDEIWDKSRLDAVHQQFSKETINEEYVHEESNPFLTSANPTEVGDDLLQQGDLGGAILAYEAATRQDPQDAQAWCNLGLSLAENEYDTRAITAFRKCLDINPANQQALLGLSVSLANENLENDALENLEKWIVAHNGGDPATVVRAKPLYSSFLDHNYFGKVEEQFLDAARQQEGAGDAELQNALGVLYNLNRNFHRAIDCMRMAVQHKPEDPRLWNRLGATLANGDQTAEAISAYREALSRYPAYVRARFNLGISCMHLSSHREAVEHFAMALESQKGEKETSSIWNTMRSAILRLPLGTGDEILQAANSRNLGELRNALRRVPA